jgi:hypothetical protein
MFFLTFQQNYLEFIKKIENFTNNELTVNEPTYYNIRSAPL